MAIFFVYAKLWSLIYVISYYYFINWLLIKNNHNKLKFKMVYCGLFEIYVDSIKVGVYLLFTIHH